MRVLFLGNNRLACLVLERLRARGEDVVGLVLNAPDRRRHGERMIRTAALPDEQVFDGSHLRDPETLSTIEGLEPTLGLSVLFGHILKPNFLDIFSQGCLNLHLGLLPYNRGAYPNVWSIVDGTPAGVTLHRIDEGIDTGDIVAQREVDVTPVDTGETLYRRLEAAAVTLFDQAWPRIRAGEVVARPQDEDAGSCHLVRDVEDIDEIHLDQTYRAVELIDIVRARTFAPYRGAYFVHNGRKVYMRLELLYEEDLDEETDR